MFNTMQKIFVFTLLLTFSPSWLLSADYPLTVVDSRGTSTTLGQVPNRVVSLVPAVTEMLIRIGAADNVVGITHHSAVVPQAAGKEVVGGFFRPDMEKVKALRPDIVFYSDLHSYMLSGFKGQIPLVCLSSGSIEGSFDQLEMLGRMFGKEDEAAAVITEQKRKLAVINRKQTGIPDEEKKRVIRIMGRETMLVPGDDSFQNNYIRAAGGIAPHFGRNGTITRLSMEEWQKFNPEVIYGCGNDREAEKLLEKPGWKDVEAVRNRRIYYFPCDLTCRAATHTGDFVSRLSSTIYRERFGDITKHVLPEQVVRRVPVDISLEYVKQATLVESDIRDFRNKSLVVEFERPLKVLSTLEGMRENVHFVGNHYFPPPSWGLGHSQGLKDLRGRTLKILGLAEESTAFLFTGADMENLAVVEKSYRDMNVVAIVTAGVAGNAVRMGKDEGRYYEPDNLKSEEKPGTINILLLSNMRFSPRAMTRAVISATEGKTVALQDLDIRSSYTSMAHPATGTGTDNIIVVEGEGLLIENSGGHTKMGELAAKAVYDGVKEAIRKQNGYTASRSIFQRLKEREVSIREIVRRYAGDVAFATEAEHLLLDTKYSSFLASALAVSDQYERGLITDLDGFDSWCLSIASDIAGKPVEVTDIDEEGLSPVLRKAIGALFSGLEKRYE